MSKEKPGSQSQSRDRHHELAVNDKSRSREKPSEKYVQIRKLVIIVNALIPINNIASHASRKASGL